MPFEKGHKEGKGRPKGSPNKATSERREWIKKVLNNETTNVQAILNKLRKDNPVAYMNNIMSLLEFDTPKLARTEIGGLDGKELKIQIYQLPDGTEIEF